MHARLPDVARNFLTELDCVWVSPAEQVAREDFLQNGFLKLEDQGKVTSFILASIVNATGLGAKS